jgi:hypothetical protein
MIIGLPVRALNIPALADVDNADSYGGKLVANLIHVYAVALPVIEPDRGTLQVDIFKKAISTVVKYALQRIGHPVEISDLCVESYARIEKFVAEGPTLTAT